MFNNNDFLIHGYVCFVKDFTFNIILLFNTVKKGLYILHAPFSPPNPRAFPDVCISLELWHHRLGHSHSCLFLFIYNRTIVIK